jgi:exoribonuclease R
MQDNNNIIYTITIHDSTYQSFTITPSPPPEITIHPVTHRLFSGDTFTITTTTTTPSITILHSPIKHTRIPGILLLKKNKTYGKYKNKHYYQCIPYNRELPIFLIPYELKIGFSKKFTNTFVLFQFTDWNDTHPHGSLLETIGSIDHLEAFDEYQLYCHGLYHSIKPLQEKTKTLPSIHAILNNYHDIINRLEDIVYTIDSKETQEYDDAFSIHSIDDTHLRLSIYITNVFFWLEQADLWKVLSQRISTIYLSSGKKTLLSPTLNKACSLRKGEMKIVSIMDIIINTETGSLGEPVYSNGYIMVKENYHYDDPQLLENTSYHQLVKWMTINNDTIPTSREVISHLMVLLNTKYAKQLYHHGKGHGIFKQLSDQISTTMIEKWSLGEYYYRNIDDVDVDDNKIYTHISSPIRRLVDIINQTIFYHYVQGGMISPNAFEFIQQYSNIQLFNQQIKSIRKIQFNSNLLYRCQHDPSIIHREHLGIVVDSSTTKYTIYLKEFKLWTTIQTDKHLENYSIYPFLLFLFDDETTLMKKIRLQLVE